MIWGKFIVLIGFIFFSILVWGDFKILLIILYIWKIIKDCIYSNCIFIGGKLLFVINRERYLDEVKI